MATKRKTVAEEAELNEEDFTEEEILRSAQNDGEKAENDKDAEIAELKAQLAQMKQDAVSEVFVPNGRGDMERIMRVAKEAAEAGEDAWKIFVKVRVPRKAGSGDDDFWVSVNGISAQIPANGEVQEMKLPYAMALMDALEAEEKAIQFSEGLKIYDPLTNPKPIG